MSDLDDISDHKYQKRIVIVIVVNSKPLFWSILSVGRGLSMYSLIPDHLMASTVGDKIASPDLTFLTQPIAVVLQSIPFIPGRET